MEINEILDSIYILSDESKTKLIQNIRKVTYPKGHILVKVNTIENNIYFIKKGVARAYSDTPDNEITFWFGWEGHTIISMKSYIDQSISYENIELLEECELYELNSEQLQNLYNQDIQIANWGRKFAEKELLKIEERLINHQFQSATERYRHLLLHHPNLIQRIQLGYIASYLGITQVSLSRIRGEIKF